MERTRSGQERPKSGQERPKTDQERAKSGQEQLKSGQERTMSEQERPKGHLGAILARFGTLLGGKIIVFPKVFQYFLKNGIFTNLGGLEPS